MSSYSFPNLRALDLALSQLVFRVDYQGDLHPVSSL